MTGRYRRAVERVAAFAVERVRRAYPEREIWCVANPRAGTRDRRRSVVLAARRRSVGARVSPAVLWTGEGTEARAEVAARIRASGRLEPIIISLGGDGTHNHVLHAGYDEGGRGLFLRLPLGSGNDAAGVRSLDDALGELDGLITPSWVPAVRIDTTHDRFLAFNIASLGLDAYVNALHDRWRSVLPGNTYRLLVNAASLGYDRFLRVQPMRISYTDEHGRNVSLGSAARSLVVFGVDGYRTYGDRMRVLPGPENMCVIGRVGLGEKMRLKKLFFQGRHVDLPITRMLSAGAAEIGYGSRMPIQFDGEARWLDSHDFPVRLEVVGRAVRVLAGARMVGSAVDGTSPGA